MANTHQSVRLRSPEMPDEPKKTPRIATRGGPVSLRRTGDESNTKSIRSNTASQHYCARISHEVGRCRRVEDLPYSGPNVLRVSCRGRVYGS